MNNLTEVQMRPKTSWQMMLKSSKIQAFSDQAKASLDDAMDGQQLTGFLRI